MEHEQSTGFSRRNGYLYSYKVAEITRGLGGRTNAITGDTYETV